MEDNPYDLTKRIPSRGGNRFTNGNPPNLYGGSQNAAANLQPPQPPQQNAQVQVVPVISRPMNQEVHGNKLDNTYEIIQPQDWARIPIDTYIRWQTIEDPGNFHKGGIVMDTILTTENETKIKVKLLGTPYFKHLDLKDVRYIYKKQAKHAPKKVQVDPNTPPDPYDEIRMLRKELEKKDQKIKQLTDIIKDISIKLAK